MRKFFLIFSILILIALLSAGIYQKINDVRSGNTDSGKEVSILYSNYINHTA